MFRRKALGHVAPGGRYKNWKPDFVLVPNDLSLWHLQPLLHAPEPPFMVQEDQLALNMLRGLTERYFDMLPEVWRKWGEIHAGPGRNRTLQYPPASWEPEPPTNWRKRWYDTDPASLCSRWVEVRPGVELPSKLARERRVSGF